MTNSTGSDVSVSPTERFTPAEVAPKKASEDPRDLFSLAQSSWESGDFVEAARHYKARADTGGADDEAWHARLQHARCLLILGDEHGFLAQALRAFNERPGRAEPLYELARYYRERSVYNTSALFCEAALALAQPTGDSKFLEEFVYTTGILEEYAIAANYARDPTRKTRGHAACNWLALNRHISANSRNLARSNLFFYAEAAVETMPSFRARQVGFGAPDYYHPTNPSVARWGEKIILVQRSVNYVLNEDGSYHSTDGAPFRTRNFLLALNNELEVESSVEILPPADLPPPLYPDETAFGDLRLFAWGDALWCTACYRELTPEGWCEQVLARIDCQKSNSEPFCRLTDWRVMRPATPTRHEKNWMPLTNDSELQFIYFCDPTQILDENARIILEATPTVAAEQFRGGSQAIPFDHGWLSLVHEVLWRNGRRFYLHRFVWLNSALQLEAVSHTFFFTKKSVEFAAGLAWHPDEERLIASFGVDDRESWIATIRADEVRRVLETVGRLPSGR